MFITCLNFNYIWSFLVSLKCLSIYLQSGPEELTKESLGVNYRALSDLFFISEQRKDTISYEVSVQMMEIYNEQVRDLLATNGINKKYPFENYLYFSRFVIG